MFSYVVLIALVLLPSLMFSFMSLSSLLNTIGSLFWLNKYLLCKLLRRKQSLYNPSQLEAAVLIIVAGYVLVKKIRPKLHVKSDSNKCADCAQKLGLKGFSPPTVLFMQDLCKVLQQHIQ